MKAELLEQLRKITPEEQEILNGRKQINEAIYVQSEGHVFAAGSFWMRPN